MNSFLNYTDTSPSIYLIVASGIKYCFNTINELKKKKAQLTQLASTTFTSYVSGVFNMTRITARVLTALLLPFIHAPSFAIPINYA